MPTTFSYNLGSAVSTATITLNSLASSATAGRQSTEISLLDANYNTPESVDFLLTVSLATGTVANDKSVYLWIAGSLDGTNYEFGPPTVGASDAAYTFSTAPGTVAPPWIGAATPQFQAQSTTQTCRLTIIRPPQKIVAVVLNYSGIALHASAGNSLQYRTRFGDLR
jgi:hypothetical protein